MTTGWAVPPGSQCVLCGATGPDVRHGLIRWRDGDPFGSGPRCADRDACHDRVMANRDEWPVDDGRPRGAPVPRETLPLAAPMPVVPDGSSIEELDFGVAPEAVA